MRHRAERTKKPIAAIAAGATGLLAIGLAIAVAPALEPAPVSICDEVSCAEGASALTDSDPAIVALGDDGSVSIRSDDAFGSTRVEVLGYFITDTGGLRDYRALPVSGSVTVDVPRSGSSPVVVPGVDPSAKAVLVSVHRPTPSPSTSVDFAGASVAPSRDQARKALLEFVDSRVGGSSWLRDRSRLGDLLDKIADRFIRNPSTSAPGQPSAPATDPTPSVSADTPDPSPSAPSESSPTPDDTEITLPASPAATPPAPTPTTPSAPSDTLPTPAPSTPTAVEPAPTTSATPAPAVTPSLEPAPAPSPTQPSPTPSPTQPSPTPSATQPSPTPTPTPTPTQTESSPTAPLVPSDPRGERPGSTTTGVPAGIRLTVVEGDIRVRVAGTVLDSLDIRGKVFVDAPNVTIKNSIIRGLSGGSTGSLITATGGYADLKVVDVELAPTVKSPSLNGITGSNFSLKRVNAHDVIDIVHITPPGKVTVSDSWLHDNAHYEQDPNWGGKPSHDDSVQIQGGSDITIVGNNIYGARNSGIQITQDQGLVGNVTFAGNWMDGGGCSFNIAEKGKGAIKGIVVRDNVFGRTTKHESCAIISPTSTVVTNINNVYTDGVSVKVRRGA